MADFTVKQHDHGTQLVVALLKRYAEEEPWQSILLGEVTQVKLLMKAAGVALVSGIATVTDALAGQITYEWDADDLNFAGEYQAEIQLTHSDGAVETVPNDGYFTVAVVADLNAGD